MSDWLMRVNYYSSIKDKLTVIGAWIGGVILLLLALGVPLLILVMVIQGRLQ